MAFHVFLTTCFILLQWEKQLENNIINFLNNYKNDYSQIGLVVKDMFWSCGDRKIHEY